MPYFVKNELYTIPDSPVDADFNGILHWCKVYRCKVIASNACSSNKTLLQDKRV